VELDAISPDTLRAIVLEAIERHLPRHQYEILKSPERFVAEVSPCRMSALDLCAAEGAEMDPFTAFAEAMVPIRPTRRLVTEARDRALGARVTAATQAPLDGC